MPDMTDAQAVELLQLLDLYCSLPDCEPDTADTLTIRMLANDLIMSLPNDMVPTLDHIGE